MATIDKLQIQIESNAQKASAGITSLKDSLNHLQFAVAGAKQAGLSQIAVDMKGLASGARSLGKVNSSSFATLASNLNTLSASLRNFQSVGFDVSSLHSLAAGVSALGKAKVGNALGGNLTALAQQLPPLITELNKFQTLTFDTQGLVNFAQAIGKLGSKSVSVAASTNIRELTVSLTQMMTELSKVPAINQSIVDMANAMAQLSVNGTKMSFAISQTPKTVASVGRSFKAAIPHARSFASVIGKMYASYWVLFRIFSFLKNNTIETASALTELQNVVNNTFGDMQYKLDDLARNSIEQFGMSELSVKKYASRYQAMGVALGLTNGQIQGASNNLDKLGVSMDYVGMRSMADMSVNLTKLTSDIASFYDISQEEVATKLASGIFAGQARPLRAFGIDLTQATLQEWALKNGIDADVKSMTQAEKTLLRYQYTMANTQNIFGDFQRTSDSWHNTIVRLGQSFQQLGIVIGQSLVNAFKPFMQAMNAALKGVIAFATAVSNALGVIFGWQYESGGGSVGEIEDALEGGADAADDIAGGTGDAADNAKKLKSYLLGIDELNVLEPDKGTESGGGGGGGGGGASAAGGDGTDGGRWVKGESIWKKYESEIDNLYDLGAYIAKVIGKSLDDINWDKVYKKAGNFGKGLAEFLNGLVADSNLFDSVGKTVAGGLNTALQFLNNFGERFHWKKFGESIGRGINSFFSTFDFKLAADTVNKIGNGVFDTILSGIKTVNWRGIGESIGTLLAGVNWVELLGKFGSAISGAMKSIATTYLSTFETAPLETATATAIGTLIATWGLFGRQVVNGVLANFNTSLGDAKLKIGLLVGAMEFGGISTGISNLLGGVGDLGVELAKVFGSLAVGTTALTLLFGPGGTAIGLLTGFVGLLAGLEDDYQKHSIATAMKNDFNESCGEIEDDCHRIADSIDRAKDSYETAGQNASELQPLIDRFDELRSKTSLTRDEQNELNDIQKELIDKVPTLSGYVNSQTGELDLEKKAVEELVKQLDQLAKKQAGQDLLVEANKGMVKSELDLKKAVKERDRTYQDAIESLGMTSDEYHEIADHLGDVNYHQANWAEILANNDPAEFRRRLGVNEYSDLYNKVKEVEDAYKENDQVVQTAQKTYDDAKQTVEETKTAIGNLETEIKETDKAIEINKQNSATYQQAVSDLGTAFDNLGSSLGDNKKLMEQLVDSGTGDAVVGMFTTMKEGANLSAGELSKLFEDLGYSLPDSFCKKMAEQDPVIQTQVATTLANISSGATPTLEEAKQLFKTAGAELPDEIIQEFLVKEPNVQQSTLGLLSKISEGESLVEGNIKTLFKDLGIAVPDELITALSTKDADTQSAAIQLLGNIKSGYDYTTPELIKAFEDLGIDLPTSLIRELANKNDPVRQQATETTNEVGKGAEAAKDTINTAMTTAANNAGDSLKTGMETQKDKVKEGTTTALNGTDEAVKTSNMADPYSEGNPMNQNGRNIINGLIEGMKARGSAAIDWVRGLLSKLNGTTKDTLDEHSPSKLYAQYGSWMIEGLIIGMNSQKTNALNAVSGIMEATNGEALGLTSLTSQTATAGTNMVNALGTTVSPANVKTATQAIPNEVGNSWNSTVVQWNHDINNWWEHNVTPWFDQAKWESITINIHKAIRATFENMVAWWKGAIETWWTTNVVTYFVVEKWQEQTDHINESVVASVGKMRESWKSLTDKWWTDDVKPIFDRSKWDGITINIKESLKTNATAGATETKSIFDQMTSDISDAFDGMCNDIESAFKKMCKTIRNKIDAMKRELAALDAEVDVDEDYDYDDGDYDSDDGGEVEHHSGGGVIKRNAAHKFAAGGFPDLGQLFLARENGPELVGNIGRNNAVANNMQIISGIAQGVQAGIAEVLHDAARYTTPTPDMTAPGFGAYASSAYASAGTPEGTTLTKESLVSVLRTELMPTLMSGNADRDNLMHQLIDKDNNVYMDGKSVNGQIKKSSRRSGFSFQPQFG